MEELHGNESTPILIGSQGCGKTTFAYRLLPPQLRMYFLDHINFANKFDQEMALTHNLIVNIDEFANKKGSQQGKLTDDRPTRVKIGQALRVMGCQAKETRQGMKYQLSVNCAA